MLHYLRLCRQKYAPTLTSLICTHLHLHELTFTQMYLPSLTRTYPHSYPLTLYMHLFICTHLHLNALAFTHMRSPSLTRTYHHSHPLTFTSQTLIFTHMHLPSFISTYLHSYALLSVIIINIRGQIENRPLQNTRSAGRK